MSYDLDRVNRERRSRGLPPMSRTQADSAASRNSSGTDMSTWLIMYAALAPSYSSPAYSHEPSPSTSSHSSSSSYDSGSSSSYDSSSSGGGFDSGSSY